MGKDAEREPSDCYRLAMTKKTDEISPISLAILHAVADRAFSNVTDSKFQKMLDERIAEQNDTETIAEAEVQRLSPNNGMLKPSVIPSGKCKICGNTVFGWKDMCRSCEEAGHGVR